MKNFRVWGLTAVAALVLGACGGGGSDTTPRSSISSVTVMGDSLADVGTFQGLKFTVQGADSKIYPERIAQSYGVDSLCPYYTGASSTTFAPSPTAGCTDYAIGGGRINNFKDPTSPLSVVVQLETAATAAGGYSDSDLLVIDGGGNDAADLVKGYLAAANDGGASYSAVLTSLLDAGVVGTNLQAGPSGFAKVGGLYMTALADMFHDAIKTNALDKGATHVAVLNMPGITNTPQFQMVLGAIEQAQGAEARAGAEAMFDGWVQAFNTELAAKFAGNANVVVVDFYTSFNDEVAHPEQYGLSNATTPACPAVGQGGDGLPTYDFPTCTDTALSAAPPAGVTDPDWWKSYAFADSFHPTPYGHQLLAKLIAKSLAAAGWL
jgi:phospholipase/lecithinase/hemolysin